MGAFMRCQIEDVLVTWLMSNALEPVSFYGTVVHVMLFVYIYSAKI